MKQFKITVLVAGVVLMVLASIASTLQGLTASHWHLLAVPLYLGLALSLWKSSRRLRA